MKFLKALSLLGFLAMTGILVYGFAAGDFGAEGTRLLNMPWGIVSMVDLYVGFSLFSGWILFREKSTWVSIVWIVLMMVLGFWTGALYTYLAARASNGDWKKFWMGNRAG